MASRICAAGGAMVLVVAGLATAGAQEVPPSRPDVFRASASSHVVSATLDREALLPIADALRFMVLEGNGTFESSNQTARASVLYPGAAGIGGPGLLCDQFGSELPAELAPVLEACASYAFPLSVAADSLHPDVETVGPGEIASPGGLVSAKGVRGVAHAAPDSSTSDATIADLRILGLLGLQPIGLPLPIPGLPHLDTTVLSVASGSSATDQRITDDGTLIVQAESLLSGVRLLGGLVQIGAIRSTTQITDDGRGETTQSASLDVSDVRVGGIQAEITEDGLVLGSPTGALGPLVQQLTGVVNDLLGGLGVQLTTLNVEKGVDEAGLSFARVGGVLLEFSLDVGGLPSIPGPLGDIDLNGTYRGSLQLGASGSTGVAAYIDIPEFVPSPSPTPDVGAIGGVETPGSAPGEPTAPVPPSLEPEVAAPALPSAPETRPMGFLGDLYAGRVTLVYLAFTLIALGLCLAPKFALPSRLPGRSQ